MGAYLARRMGINLLVFFLITVAIFGLVHAAPGDPIALMFPPAQANAGTEALKAQLRHEYGFDLPVYVQYWHWLVHALHGNLGFSVFSGQPVSSLLAQRLGPTLLLMGSSLVVTLIVAVPLGIIAARKRNSVWDYGAAVISMGSVSTPVFFIGLIAIYIFTLKFQLLPTSGMNDPTHPGLADSLRHLVLPALILGFGNSGPYMRYVRSSMIGELGSDYVRTAEAKGAGSLRVVVRHAFRNSLIPVLTVLFTSLPQYVAGAVTVEQVFAWPGMGQLAVASVKHADYSVIVGFALLIAVLILLSNVVADVLYTVVDPRVRLT